MPSHNQKKGKEDCLGRVPSFHLNRIRRALNCQEDASALFAKEAKMSQSLETLKAVSILLEEMQLPEVARIVKSKAESAMRGQSVDTQPIEKFLNKILQNVNADFVSLNSTEIHPASPWSFDATEKSAVPMLQNILESFSYIPRHFMNKMSSQLETKTLPSHSYGPMSSDSAAYPRYRAPQGRNRSEGPLSFFPSLSLMKDYTGPLSPQTLTTISDKKRSEEYFSKPAGPKENDPFDPTDQYRDDDDPGYRIRDLWEADLIVEIQARESGDAEALKIPYYAAFTCTNLKTGKKLYRHPQYGIKSGLTKDDATSISKPPSSGSLKQTDTSHHFELRNDTTSFATSKSNTPSNTPKRSLSSKSSHSIYALNSTPPRRSGSRRHQTDQNDEGSTLAFNNVGTSPSLPSEGARSQRCSSPTFGTPQEAPENLLDSDDELSGAASASQPVESQQSGQNLISKSAATRFESPVMSLETKPEIVKASTQENAPLAESQLLSPKSPVFGVEESLIDATRSRKVDTKLQDELIFCSPEPFHEKKTNPFSDKGNDEEASNTVKDAQKWRLGYSDGNSEIFRNKKIKEKMTNLPSVLYPASDDPNYPIIDENNKVESQLGQAAFSKALRCYDKKTKQHVCMKVIGNDKDYVDQSLDEIKLLRYINCNGDVDLVHCLRLYDFFYYKEHLILVTELLKENLYDFSRKHREKKETFFTIGRIQRIAYQILTALQYIHSLRLIHSDLKPENILMKNVETCEIKVIDFGSSCFEDDILSLYVQSRSYRAPEVLLGLPYDQKIDLWSLGCILAELWTGYVLFQNDSTAALLARIVGILGQLPYYMVCRGQSVSEHFTQDGQLFRVKNDEPSCPKRGKRIRILLPKSSNLTQRLRTHDKYFINFISLLLQIDPSKRLTAKEALRHPFLSPNLYSDGL